MPHVATAVDSLGFDCAAKLNASRAKQAYDAGYRFVVRYVGLGPTPNPGDLDRNECDLILASGLALMVVQHVRYPGWSPTKAIGRVDGVNASLFAKMAGYLGGAQLWVDAEGMSPASKPQDVIEYLEAWFTAVRSNYAPGLYVGYGVPLTPSDLWHLSVDRYWSDYGPRKVEKRGFCMKQIAGNVSAFGIKIDPDYLHADELGGYPKWVIS